MGIWIEMGIFALALAFGLWQIHDVKKARETTRRQRAQAAQAAAADNEKDAPPAHGAGTRPSGFSERR